ncbi:hypothetical protein SASPL_140069 [Salvia splendens]|uniref:Uncharacterized protein n=1 Tax=Salvia splendens TaxID=180675 RepID=A0A8X8WPB6_SALSN|nr:hypothetical protein SASPL_140069 [Salvia splendens]
MQALRNSTSSFSGLLSDLSPDLLIYDLFQPWSAKIAAARGIPAVHFFTGGAAAGSFMHHWHSHGSFDDFPFQELSLTEHEKKRLYASKKFVKVENGEQGFLFGLFELSCDVVLIKSCRAIEGKYMDYLSTLCGRKLIPTSPLIAHGGGAGDGVIMEWLSKREKGSTLYISFGSENFLNEKEMAEIAKGLDMVDVSFIWVTRRRRGCRRVLRRGWGGGGWWWRGGRRRQRSWRMGAWGGGGVHEPLRVEFDHGELVFRGSGGGGAAED